MELLLIRHGLPLRVENDDGTPADPVLAPHGRDQAKRLADWLESERLDAIYASPLRRAFQTAEPLAARHGLELQVEPGVVEFDQHAASYVPLEELKANDYERWKELVQGGLYAAIDIEAFRRGVAATLERIIADHSGACVAVVCHGGVINSWTSHVLGIANPLFFQPSYTSVSRFLAAGSGERSVVSLNESAHLRARP
jgi:probable phosphoglycerate mutase